LYGWIAIIEFIAKPRINDLYQRGKPRLQPMPEFVKPNSHKGYAVFYVSYI
jgi:hypothetical protein